ncbi:TIGR03792 family protein [Kamptonema cortianum]|uniref:TIGR03792 family protein n=1 Tax=Geitlerinema calcuttense NRMC-F 0142 TaxID=2922238 RepID=A0ABT7M027_9CYAN|nr:TIGR03792 family protein [Geitlerinema calcuttense]MCD8488865.1 TIGR03792 family protein [Desertifilum sp.]MDK3160129.1 TIGR03792 family protein [Kamptonema cortianum]MDL5057621.1 TIGR03792 family protein [Geitlerinema calcuttense NRMC-F 0142]
MVIEWLRFQVPTALREKFIQLDDRIWSPFLASYPGYLSKEIWINPDEETEIAIAIRWESLEAWKSIPSERLQQVEAEFSQAMSGDYQLLEGKAYQVRKFPQTSPTS